MTSHAERWKPARSLFNPLEVVFCGYSGSGKTTLIEKLLFDRLGGLSLGYAKSDAHGFAMDHFGKDTERAGRAGAAVVLIHDFSHQALLSNQAPSLFVRSDALLDCDAVLIEGYKDSDSPKILVLDEEGRALADLLDGRFRNVLACAGASNKMTLPNGIPYYSRDDIKGISAKVRGSLDSRIRNTPLFGLILAGGRSIRMGVDKWKIAYHRKPQALHQYRMLSALCEQTFVSLRPEQLIAPELARLPHITDSIADAGPLGGILSAMRAHPGAAFLTVACDLPQLDSSTLGSLITARNAYRFATAYVSPHDDLPEPLCAIYEPKCAGRIGMLVGLGYNCPRKLLLNGTVNLIQPAVPGSLTNVNTPEEKDRHYAR